MSYELKPEKPAGEELARIIAQEIEAVVEILNSADVRPLPERVHRSRVGLKRVRAALSLAKPDMRKFCERHDALYRDAGRKLSAWRDAEVLIETFNRLQEKFASQLAGESLSSVRGFLVSRRRRALADRSAVENTIRDAAAILSKSRKSLLRLHVVRSICPGMKADYRHARKAFLHAYGAAGDVSFHEWRKSVKRYLYHVEMLENSLPDSWKLHRKSLKKLADLLGDDHNLAVLNETLRHRKSALPPLIEQWQKELRTAAATLGAEAFSEKTRRFGKLFQKTWSDRDSPTEEEPFLIHRASA